MKDLYKLQREAREMQKKMKAIHVHGESDDQLVVVHINGAQDVEDVEIHDELLDPSKKRDLVRDIKQALKDGQKKIQKELMKDMDVDKLKGMLGN